MHRKILFLLFTSLILKLSIAQDCPIFPHPTTFKLTDGVFSFGELIKVSKRNLTSVAKNDIRWYFTQDLTVNTLFSNEESECDVIFKRYTNVPQDAYNIKVDKRITITYSTDASLFYALTSLKQLIVKNDDTYEVPYCFMADESKFSWRGMHLDVSRHFFTVNEVKQYLDWMSRYKFNRFHWHLTDDQGWRIEIKQFPKLTSIGSVRSQTLIGHASEDPEKYDGNPHTGYYTQNEIKEIVDYAEKLYIEVIPEIEMPGHARAALASYPQFSCDGKQLPVAQSWGVFDKVFCSKDSTLDFLKAILAEVLVLFPGKYIHIGGDEAPKTNWETCPNCQAQIEKHGLESETELQSFFIKEIDRFLSQNGKKLIGWDEILEGGLSPNATVMSWRGVEGGIEAVNQNHEVIMTPGSHCYFDHYQSDRPNEPLAIGGYTPLKKVYAFQPIPADMAASKQGLVLGAQANLWTEYISDFRQVEYMILPRMIALSQVLWGTNTEPYSEFLERLKKFELPVLERKGVNFSKAAFYLQANFQATEQGVSVSFQQNAESKPVQVRYTYPNGIKKIDERTYELNRTTQPTINKITAVSGLGIEADSVQINVLQHSTLGSAWNLLIPPSKSYAGSGAYTLTDGIIGTRPWNGKEWLGFDGGVARLDYRFTRKKRVNNITVSMLNAPSSWIYLPETILVRSSKNGRKWKEVFHTVQDETSKIPLKGKIRYIELKIVTLEKIPPGKHGAGHTPWLFLDEIYFNK